MGNFRPDQAYVALDLRYITIVIEPGKTCMKAIIQKVLRSSVVVDKEIVGSIGKGYNVLLGIARDDTSIDAEWVKIVKKLLKMRLWNKSDPSSALSDSASLRWSDNIEEAGGSILLISQFTLYSQLKGNKVDFHRAMKGVYAEVMYDAILRKLREALPGKVEAGKFGAMMQVEILNDGRMLARTIHPRED